MTIGHAQSAWLVELGGRIAVASSVQTHEHLDRPDLGSADLDPVVVRVGDVKMVVAVGEAQTVLKADNRSAAVLVAENEQAVPDNRPDHGSPALDSGDN